MAFSFYLFLFFLREADLCQSTSILSFSSSFNSTSFFFRIILRAKRFPLTLETRQRTLSRTPEPRRVLLALGGARGLVRSSRRVKGGGKGGSGCFFVVVLENVERLRVVGRMNEVVGMSKRTSKTIHQEHIPA